MGLVAGRRGPAEPRVRGAEEGVASHPLALNGVGNIRFLGGAIAWAGAGGSGAAATRGLRRTAPSATAARRGEGASSTSSAPPLAPPRGEKALGKAREEGVDGRTGRRAALSCRA